MYLTLKSNVLISKKGEIALLYNTQNKKSFSFSCVNYISDIINMLLNITNMYSIQITDDMYSKTKFWIDKIVNDDYAYISQDNYRQSIPPQLIISPKCDQDKEKYLHKVVINLGCNEANSYYKQFFYPMYSTKDRCNFNDFTSFLQSTRKYNIKNITFITDDICRVSKFIEFVNNSDNIFKNNTKITIVTLPNSLNLISQYNNRDVDIVLMYKNLSNFLNRNSELDSMSNLTSGIILESESELISLLSSSSYTENIKMYPFYNGHNISFFEKYVYMDKADLENMNISKKIYFRNQVINPIYFGQVYLLPNGQICADPNFLSVASIGDSIDNIIEYMMSSDYAWKFVRKMFPCKNCLYQWLCPPVSNYELVLKHPLCYNFL